MATNVIVKQASGLMSLATETREMIYRHLLVSEYTTTTLNFTCKEYDCHRASILDGPDQKYQFHTEILGANRQIYAEARDLCRRENNFICLTSRRPSRLGFELEKRGLQTTVKRLETTGFWMSSMTLTLDPTSMVDASEDGRPWRYIFCSDEIPNFCRLLLEMSLGDDTILRDTILHIDINPDIWKGATMEIDSHEAGRSRIKKLLEPLRQLHSFGAAPVEGPVSSKYKEEIFRSVSGDCPTAMDVINIAMVALKQGDEHIIEGQVSAAKRKYGSALSYVRSCCWHYDERDFIVNSGPFPGLQAVQVMTNLQLRIQARLAASFLNNGMLRMARIYTERSLDSRRRYDRGWKTYSPTELDIEPWENVVFAEILHVSANINYAHGAVWDALADLWEAGQLEPLDDEQHSKYEIWEEHEARLRTRRTNRLEAQKLQRRKRIEKAEGIIRVVCNWKRKGDRLIRNGSSNLAASTCQAALSKLDLLKDRPIYFSMRSTAFEGFRSKDAINALSFKLQASLAAALLMSRKYEEVDRRTDFALKCDQADTNCAHKKSCPHCSLAYSDYNRDWIEDQKLDYLRIHYCKAIALKNLGDTTQAVVHMEKAQGFDPGDGHVFAQLVLLKQKLEEDKARAREQRLGKLNTQQSRLRRKQIDRKEKARR